MGFRFVGSVGYRGLEIGCCRLYSVPRECGCVSNVSNGLGIGQAKAHEAYLVFTLTGCKKRSAVRVSDVISVSGKGEMQE